MENLIHSENKENIKNSPYTLKILLLSLLISTTLSCGRKNANTNTLSQKKINPIEIQNTKSLFNSLEKTPFISPPEAKIILAKLQGSKSFKDIFDHLTSDPELLKILDSYFISIGWGEHDKRTIHNGIMTGLLLEHGLIIDDNYTIKDNAIESISLLTKEKIEEFYPSLTTLNTGEHNNDIAVYISKDPTLDGGLSGLGGKILINQNKEQDVVLLNEITGEIFDNFSKHLREKRPDLINKSGMNIPYNGKYKAISETLGDAPYDTQRNEYRGDITTLYYYPQKALEAIIPLSFPIDGLTRAYTIGGGDPRAGERQGITLTNKTYNSYGFTKFHIAKFICSEEFLSQIPYKESTLRNFYNKAMNKEARDQLVQSIYSEPGYTTIGDIVRKEISKNPQAIKAIQTRAKKEKRELEIYLNSLLK